MTFDEWFDKRGVWPRLTYKEIWDAAQLAEREACAALCDVVVPDQMDDNYDWCAAKADCAAEIRARSNG